MMYIAMKQKKICYELYYKRYKNDIRIILYYIVSVQIVRKQAPAICKTKSVYLLFAKTFLTLLILVYICQKPKYRDIEIRF